MKILIVGSGVAGDAEHITADNAQRMGDDRDHMAVLLDIFMYRIAHEAPALDVSHP